VPLPPRAAQVWEEESLNQISKSKLQIKNSNSKRQNATYKLKPNLITSNQITHQPNNLITP
jgi:hypothetical protein